MNTNWYILYARPGKEKKMTLSLEKKKIKHFLPMQFMSKGGFFKTRIMEEPLFPGYIFVFTSSEQLLHILESDSDIRIIYWKNEPAIIPENEITSIKRFISSYEDIKVKRIRIGTYNSSPTSIEVPSLIVEEEPLSFKNEYPHVVLPSLGYSLTAKEGRHLVTLIRESKTTSEVKETL